MNSIQNMRKGLLLSDGSLSMITQMLMMIPCRRTGWLSSGNIVHEIRLIQRVFTSVFLTILYNTVRY